MARKKTGDIRFKEVGANDSGLSSVTPIGDRLPENKEEIEAIFGARFIRLFNSKRLMPGVEIRGAVQQTTADLDFKIECWRADYLELAEITPLSADFGKDVSKGSPIQTLVFATWIYENVVKAKADKYGRDLANRTFLLVYPTFPEFFPNNALVDCLRSLCWYRGSTFAGIFLLWSSGQDDGGIHLPYVISPWSRLAPPEAFSDHTYTNLDLAPAPGGLGAIGVPFGS